MTSASLLLVCIAALPASLGFQTHDSTPCPDLEGNVTLISEARSLQLGSEVTVTGIVTAVLPGLSGYFIQDPDGGDNDPATSDGIFVYNSSAAVLQGQLVQITATTDEYNGNKQLVPQTMEVCGTKPLPAPAVLDQLPTRAEAPGVWASLQGMLITVSGLARVTGQHYLPRYAEIRLSTGGRLMSVSNFVDPNLHDDFDSTLASYRDTLILSDGNTEQNTDPVQFPGGGLSRGNYIRVGDAFSNVTGPLSYRGRGWTVDTAPGLPSPVHVARNPRPQPPAVGGRITVAAFNVLNYFNGPPGGAPFDCGDSFQCRGAKNEFEFERQRHKMISAMVALDATVFVLNEMENNGAGPDSAAQDLVNGLNAAMGPGTYSTVTALPDKIGDHIWVDVIANPVIYQPSQVKVVGTAILQESVDPQFLNWNRPAVAVTFEELIVSPNQFTVVANHLKSKGGSCADNLGDPDDPRSGNCNGVRTNGTLVLGRWLQTYPTGIQTDDVLIAGDMNAHPMESPIQTLIQEYGYTDMPGQFLPKSEAYSFVYIGHSGMLDHALASTQLRSKVQGAGIWHINADESTAFDYGTAFKSEGQIEEWYAPDPWRCSDHDPVIVGFYEPNEDSFAASSGRSMWRSIALILQLWWCLRTFT